MKPDKGLLKALVDKLTNYRATVPVFPIKERSLDEMEKTLTEVGKHFVKEAGFGEMRYAIKHQKDRTIVLFQEGISACIFHASGAMAFHRNWHPLEKIIVDNVDRADLKLLQGQTEDSVKRLELVRPTKSDYFRFEHLWQLKASGITHDGKTGPVALTRVVGAFRRYIGELPVWGRASIFIQLAGENQIASTGIDWRQITGKALDETKIISEEEGALRILSELQMFLPGKALTQDYYIPDFFSLGYFSMPKRHTQTVMQPVYAAMFKPVKSFPSAGRLIVVPAGANLYEHIGRSVELQPPTASRPTFKVITH